MSTEGFNQALWAIQREMGWWFWLPFVAYGLYGMWFLYRMPAAITKTDRRIRVLLAMAFTCMIFIPAFNGLGAYGFHLIAFATCLMITQQYGLCKAAGKIKPPEASTFLGRTVERMTDHPKGLA